MDFFEIADEAIGRVNPFDERSVVSLDTCGDVLDTMLDTFNRLLGE